jgi:hypothetical protein
MSQRYYYNLYINNKAVESPFEHANKMMQKAVEEKSQSGHVEHFAERNLSDAIAAAKANPSNDIGAYIYYIDADGSFIKDYGFMSKESIYDDFPHCTKIKEELL